MLKWIAKLLGETPVELPVGVPEVWASRLAELVAPLDNLDGAKGRRGLAHDIVSYVLHGEPLSILNEAAQRLAIGEYLRLLGFDLGRQTKLPDVYEHFDAVPVDVALRWARFVDASASSHKHAFRIPMPSGATWPEALMLASARRSVNGWSSDRPKPLGLSAQKIEALLAEDGIPEPTLLIAAFATPVAASAGFAEQRLLMVSDLAGYGDALDRHIEAVRPHLLSPEVPQRLHVLRMLAGATPAQLDKLAPQLCELGVASSKQVRTLAESVLRKCGEAVFAPLRAIAADGKPEQRANALRLIATLAAERKLPEMIAFANETAAADKAPSVQALIDEWATAQNDAKTEAPGYTYKLPEIDWSPDANRLPAKLLDTLWREIDTAIDKSNAGSREHHARLLAQGHKFPLHQTALFTADDRNALQSYLDGSAMKPPRRDDIRHRALHLVAPTLYKLAAADGVTPVALLKLLVFFGLAVTNDDALQNPAVQAFATIHRRTGRPTLLELSRMLDDAGHAGSGLLRNYCHGWGASIAADWPPDDVWPYFAHHIDLLVQTLMHDPIKDYAFDRSGLFRALATLPAPPAQAINALFTLALGSGKSDRAPAQAALERHPGKEARIIAALSDGKADARAIAAQWLGRLRHAAAVPVLEKAVASEKNDLAKGAMLDALELLGQPVEKYLDREALARETAKSLAKGMPKDFDWFPLSALPVVRWADTKSPVDAKVLQWMIVQAVKQKQPEPNAVLRKYCAMLEPRDREALGQFVLESWLREDIRPIAPDDAMAHADAHAKTIHASMAQFPQYYQNDPKLGMSVETLRALFLPGYLRQPTASAIGSKGLLAVAAACAGERAAPVVQRYLKEWYGTRAAQGKALIAMLAWIEHPSATQLMLSIGSRFRTKSFQEEATKQAELLADRKGWTLAELADRTVPSAGFDETGTLELSYGERVFQAKLLPDFKIELFNPDGRKIGSLPEPRADDDAEQAKDSKKALAAAKNELKSIVELQRERLYEALCTEREWSFTDWSAYLQQHPVLRHLVQRLVWVWVESNGARKVAGSFRLLDDGTLSDNQDNQVVLPTGARIRLAHDSSLTADEVAAWQQHLIDYEIVPLFQQLGKGRYALPADKVDADSIKDYEGHLIEAFALRGRALKLGYTRGAAEDGGWFYRYHKHFPTLGLQAVLEFTGNGLPEENRTVALLNMSFTGSSVEPFATGGGIALSKVPKVLLSECWNDLRSIAADGTGYHADWQKMSEY